MPIADRLHSAAVHLLRYARATDAESGLTPARTSVLSVLVFGGERSVGALAAEEQVSAPTMSRLVSALEADGWVERRPSRGDGRVVRVCATARARAMLTAARERRVARVAALLEGLTADECALLDRAAAHIECAVRQARGDAGGPPPRSG
ncbi:MAG TPA: MarR family transcriptional regulator [Longimicrobiales bacterium]|nr:MarR family transcriptional regulator [Longimicrobiales bacterium]